MHYILQSNCFKSMWAISFLLTAHSKLRVVFKSFGKKELFSTICWYLNTPFAPVACRTSACIRFTTDPVNIVTAATVSGSSAPTKYTYWEAVI